MDALSLIVEALGKPDGKTVLDIGCGPGLLAKPLAGKGCRWFGIEPDRAAVEAAARRGLPVAVGTAESLPFAGGTFDACIFMNSLHHVPRHAMGQAVDEAARASRLVVVIEPKAEGALYEALLPIDDETEVRNAAQRVLASAPFASARRVEYVRRERFETFDAFLTRMLAADRSREAAAAARRAELEAAFRKAAIAEDGGYVLSQPMWGHILRN